MGKFNLLVFDFHGDGLTAIGDGRKVSSCLDGVSQDLLQILGSTFNGNQGRVLCSHDKGQLCTLRARVEETFKGGYRFVKPS